MPEGLDTRDHPRVCGDQAIVAWPRDMRLGSSPRVRGPGHRSPRGRRAVRIIPACAGTSSVPAGIAEGLRDHPRVCGDQMTPVTPGGLRRGSSPRVRGPEWTRPGSRKAYRIIPACAGTRTTSSQMLTISRDHPRVCGDQNVNICSWGCIRGSSPRVRGPVD